MADWRDSVVLLTNDAPGDTNFGTGFVFHRDGSGRSFVLTCLHVVTALAGGGRGTGSGARRIRANDLTAEVWARGDKVLDLAVLAVDGLDAEPLPLGPPAAPGQGVEIAGYTWMEAGERSLTRRRVDGSLCDCNPVRHRSGPERARYRDLKIADDLFRALRPGYAAALGGPDR